ncbi:MAG: pilus assembly protein PilM, partial [Nitrospiria bacterium]
VPGDLVSTRELTLPFTDLKKIGQIVPFEAEGELPFDLEDSVLDYMVLNRPQNNLYSQRQGQHQETPLLVSAIPNTTLKGCLAQLQAIGIDPAWVGFNPLALFSFATYLLPDGLHSEDELLVIDLGAKRTTLCHVQGGRLNWVRTLPLGGEVITEHIAEVLDLSREAAEQKKREMDLGMEDPTDEASIVALEAVEAGIAKIATEIEKTRQVRSPSHPKNLSETEAAAADTEEAPQSRRFFHLCGGGSKLKGLETHLAALLEMSPLEIDYTKGSRAGNIQGIEDMPADAVSTTYASALGLALQDREGPPINFRQGEFVFGKETLERRHRLVSFALILLFLLGLMGGDLYLHYQKKEARYQTIKTTLRQAFTTTFPNVRNVVNEVEQTRAAITARRQTGKFFGIHEKSPLTILKEITEAVPKNVKIDVFNLVIDGGVVRIQAETDSFESVDRIRGGLLSARHFRQVEVSDAKAAASQKQVRFRIKMTVSEKEQGGKK